MSKSKHSQVEEEGAYGRSFEALTYLTPIAQPFLACPGDKLGGDGGGRAGAKGKAVSRSVGRSGRTLAAGGNSAAPPYARTLRPEGCSVLRFACPRQKVMLRCSCYFALDNSMCITTRTVRCGGVVYLTQELPGMWRPQRCGGRRLSKQRLHRHLTPFALLVNFVPPFPPPLQISFVRLIARQNHVVDVIRVSVIAAAPVESVQSEYSEFPQPAAAARLASVMLQVEAETLDLRRRRQRRFERLNTSM